MDVRLSELSTLQKTLNRALDAVQAELTAHGLPELTTRGAPHTLDDPSHLCSPRFFEARRLALASLGQLKHILQVPYEKVVEQSLAVYDTACLDIFVRTGIVDKLVGAGPEGLHILELQQALALDSFKLLAILRYLAVQGWVHETQENNFALSRPGLELRIGSNGRKWALTPGKARIAASLLEAITSPEWKWSTSPSETAFQLSHKTSFTLFEYLKNDPTQLLQWSSSVRSLGDVNQLSLLTDYPWHKLTSHLIVDCGGGQGFLSMALAAMLPDHTFLIQDLPEVITMTEANLYQTVPSIVNEGRIGVTAHNFFEPQPRISQPTTFIFRYILHDWPDSECVSILRNTVAAGTQSKILIIEFIARPSIPSQLALDDSLDRLTDSKVYRPIPAPAYVPVNFGVASKVSLGLGVHLLGVFNARERSLAEWRSIVLASGLTITSVHPLRANISVIECDIALLEPSPLGKL